MTNKQSEVDNYKMSVGIKVRPTGNLSIYAKEVWNEAIEAALKTIKNNTPPYYDQIRKLKK